MKWPMIADRLFTGVNQVTSWTSILLRHLLWGRLLLVLMSDHPRVFDHRLESDRPNDDRQPQLIDTDG